MKPHLVVTDSADTLVVVPMSVAMSLLTLSGSDNAVRVLVSAADMRKLAVMLMTAAQELDGKP